MTMRKLFSLFNMPDARSNNVAKNIIASFVIKGAALVVSLLTMPIYMDFFRDEAILGVWYTVLSVMSWILNFDLGIGNGLRNKLSASFARNDTKTSQEYISSGYMITGGIVAVFSLLGCIVIPTLDWNAILNIHSETVTQDVLATTICIVFVGMMLQFFFRLISSILYALQKSSINNLIALITSVSQMLFALVAPARSNEDNLIIFSVAYIVCANTPLIVATVVVFRRDLQGFAPRMCFVRKDKIKDVVGLGGLFFGCQIFYMLIANTNEFLITNLTAPEAVVDYQVYYKLFTLGSTLTTLALTPMWSAITKAISENDYSWLHSVYKRLLQVALLSVLCEFLIVPFTQILINLWLGSSAIQVDYGYALLFAVYAAVLMYQSVLSTFACGLGKLKLQTICYILAIFVKFVFAVVGVRITENWIVIVAVSACSLIPYCVLEQIHLSKMMKSFAIEEHK